ncbi:hypothetical protein WJ20_15365 [Burkholderia vietnamiensis]|nr:hypothetical protein WJ02_19925 [Burkholderia vietnamiensis]KVF89990.1 hypothetical protein WJ20_15365 [Burkholderia vietnamiensis]KVR82154.1 hypothetical protein WK27_02100 [Burkholderia vietnamiensis]KVS00214.1 hypothetical protein WK29_29895 [Burkholderia vietnamiensis]KVS06021.1 hypothetical protein WK30_06240 [Burkholderia vietnamiensis]
MPCTQAGMAKTANVVIRTTEPAAQEPEQLISRVVERWRMHRAKLLEFGFEIHQVIEAVDELAHSYLPPNEMEGRCLLDIFVR